MPIVRHDLQDDDEVSVMVPYERIVGLLYVKRLIVYDQVRRRRGGDKERRVLS
jgi:hypothetical protein